MIKGTAALAIFGGTKAVNDVPKDIFQWPIITEEDENAVLDVLRRQGMSGIDVTKKFEAEICDWLDVKYALGHHNGTAALQAAMYGIGIGHGDEIICPSITYWASALPVFSLGGTVVFADIDPQTLCIDPNDIERHITDRTKAIVVVHYASHPADMDAIMEIAEKHDVKVIEDVSHAQGGTHRGRRLGTIGDVGAMSMMSGKAFAIGEAGMLITNDETVYNRAIAFGHHERITGDPELLPFQGAPLGGYKYRMHQLSSAVGRVQLKHYDKRVEEIDQAMTYFWDALEGTPGIRAHRPQKEEGYRSGGWYYARGLYQAEELGGLSITRFCEALRAEGVDTSPGCNLPLHTHPTFVSADVYGHGRPTRSARSNRTIAQPLGSLPVAEGISAKVFGVPWLKKFRPELIDQYILAFRKVTANYKKLLADDPGNPEQIGGWGTFVVRQ